MFQVLDKATEEFREFRGIVASQWKKIEEAVKEQKAYKDILRSIEYDYQSKIEISPVLYVSKRSTFRCSVNAASKTEEK